MKKVLAVLLIAAVIAGVAAQARQARAYVRGPEPRDTVGLCYTPDPAPVCPWMGSPPSMCLHTVAGAKFACDFPPIYNRALHTTFWYAVNAPVVVDGGGTATASGYIDSRFVVYPAP